VAAMTLHHVPNVVAILADLGKMLAKGGWLAIADLQLEDGSFHADLKVPHNGFNPENKAHDITGAIGADSCPWQPVEKRLRTHRIMVY
jgi:hypothetical protein